jgi:hypothetical protein
MRLDYLVLFQHGFKHINEILDILRSYEDLELLCFRKYEPHDFIQFIEYIYRTNAVPWQHIKGKTKYLEGIGKDVYVGLIRNNKPEEKLVGEGEFRHIQCMLINRFKWEVREKFNPVINGERSEHHIIHTSDFESQTIDFWKSLPFNHIESILSHSNEILKSPFHLTEFTKYNIEEVNIEELMIAEMTDNNNREVPIKESIAYKYVCGDKQKYIDYWDKFKGEKLWFDNSPGAFDKLINEFDLNKVGNIYVFNGVVQDGVHRLSIMLSKGISKWRIINIK